MRLKAFRLLFLVLLMGVVVYSLPSKALDPAEPTSEKYLIDHGHSQEIIRMINLQKERTEGKVIVPSKSEGKFKKFFKNVWFEQDLTLPVTDFGYAQTKSAETGKSSIPPAIKAVPPTIKTIKSKYIDKNKNKDSKEINVNEVKVRETE
ncbi:MAG: hypothetical protein A2039_01135 [Candidatus Melainabacteria bacterium GWA2_34_9]|nr:MAG: hypothetical protein A2039_01135 [Candidatus Melainabacteria bacterium GWA2_34_9]